MSAYMSRTMFSMLLRKSREMTCRSHHVLGSGTNESGINVDCADPHVLLVKLTFVHHRNRQDPQKKTKMEEAQKKWKHEHKERRRVK